jgi:hypothetical protein
MVGKTGLKVAAILFGLTLSTVGAAGSLGDGGRIETTDQRIAGVISELDEGTMTLSPMQGDRVPGRLDATKTRVVIYGHAASIHELRQGYLVRARLGLDEVWDNVVVYKP